jgi:protein phosphatase
VGHGLSDVGRRREVNEDSYLILPKNHLWIVADGMGGHAGGQYASTMTVEMIGRILLKRLVDAESESREAGTPIEMGRILNETIREVCAAVYDRAVLMPELRGMGSTVTAMLAYGDMAWFGHVGDSRAYLIRDGQIHQVTEDHSLVQEQVAAGLITPEQAKHSMIRNIITRSIGFERDVRVDTAAVPLKRGDQFLLCSDGLTGHVEDDEILEIVTETPRRSVASRLIDRANALGGEDNSTVILSTVVSKRGKSRGNRRRKRGS